MKRSIRTRAKYKKLYSRVSKKKKSCVGSLLIKSFVFIIILVLTGLIYARQKNENVLLGYRVQKIKLDINKLVNEHQQLQSRLDHFKTPQSLRAALEKHKLNLVPPTQEQIISLNKPEPLTYSSSTHQAATARARPQNGNYTRLVQR